MKIVHEMDRAKWSEFVKTHPQGNIFQTPEMYDVYKGTKRYDPLVVGVASDAGDLLAVLLSVVQREPLSIVSGLTARSIIWGGPLVKKDDADATRAILQAYDDLAGRNAIYTQVRNLWDTGGQRAVFEDEQYAYERHLNIIVDISKSEDVLWKEVHSKRRNEIRRAQREGTSVQELVELSDIERAYEILTEVYRHAKLPMADKTMFMTAFEVLRPAGMCRYFGSYNSGNLVGVMCLLAYKGCLYDWYAGSLRHYLNKYPNDLLPWEVFRWGREHGYACFDFGGAGVPDKDYGVRDYKKKFGGMLVDYGRFQKIHKPTEYLLGKMGYKAWRFLRGRGLQGAG